jgi:hypothetical protein
MMHVLSVVPLRVRLGVGLLFLVFVGGVLHLPMLVGERLPVHVVLLLLYVMMLVGLRLFLLLLLVVVGIGLLLLVVLLVVLQMHLQVGGWLMLLMLVGLGPRHCYKCCC